MKNIYVGLGVLILSIMFGAQTAVAQYSFGDDVDSLKFNSDGSIKFEDAVDSIDVGGVKVDSSGKVEVKDIKFQDSTDSINVKKVKVDSKGNFEVEDVEVKDSVDSIKVDGVKGKIEKEDDQDDDIFEISVDADDFDFEIEEDKGVKIENAEKVKTADDLKVYVSENVKKNKSIEKVDFKDESMVVEYKSQGKLFGFIPVGLLYKVNVDVSDNTVNVKLPWWHIFASKKVKASSVSESVQAKITANQISVNDGANSLQVKLGDSQGIKVRANTFSAILNVISAEVE